MVMAQITFLLFKVLIELLALTTSLILYAAAAALAVALAAPITRVIYNFIDSPKLAKKRVTKRKTK